MCGLRAAPVNSSLVLKWVLFAERVAVVYSPPASPWQPAARPEMSIMHQTLGQQISHAGAPTASRCSRRPLPLPPRARNFHSNSRVASNFTPASLRRSLMRLPFVTRVSFSLSVHVVARSVGNTVSLRRQGSSKRDNWRKSSHTPRRRGPQRRRRLPLLSK